MLKAIAKYIFRANRAKIVLTLYKLICNILEIKSLKSCKKK